MASKCRNGPSCVFLARGVCVFRHSREGEGAVDPFNAMMTTRMQKEDMKRLFELMDPEVQETSCIKYAEDEILRRIGKSDKNECLKVLQETVRREEERFNSLEEKALGVMTRSYSFFSAAIWTQYACKELSFEAFKKLASAAKEARVILDWDKQEYNIEEFEEILVWIETKDIEQRRRDLVVAVFMTGVMKTRASVLKWMRETIETWERNERKREEEWSSIGTKFQEKKERRRRINELRSVIMRNPRDREALLVEIMNLLDQSDSEDEEEYYRQTGIFFTLKP